MNLRARFNFFIRQLNCNKNQNYISWNRLENGTRDDLLKTTTKRSASLQTFSRLRKFSRYN